MKDSRKKNILKTVLIIGIIAGSILGSYGLICLLWNTDTPITVVEGTSMETTLYEGDILFVKKPRDLGTIQNGSHTAKTGDILVFYSPVMKFLVVHRVIDKNYSNGKWYFNTQGDNDVTPDNLDPHIYGFGGGYLPEDYIKGIVIGSIPWIGNIGIFLRDSGIAIFLIIIILGYLIISTIFEPKSKEAPEDSDTSEKNSEPI